MLIGVLSVLALLLLLVGLGVLIVEFPPVAIIPLAVIWWFHRSWKRHVASLQQQAPGQSPAGTPPGQQLDLGGGKDTYEAQRWRGARYRRDLRG
jgi:hypothetical protein